jgi:hypothetical protein
MRRDCSERGAHTLDDRIPIAGPLLAEETHGGVPRRVVAIFHPPPVGIGREERPGRDAECAGEMRGHGVDGDDEVHGAHELRGLHRLVHTVEHRDAIGEMIGIALQ